MKNDSNININSHPVRVFEVEGDNHFFANSHPYQVKIVGGGSSVDSYTKKETDDLLVALRERYDANNDGIVDLADYVVHGGGEADIDKITNSDIDRITNRI